MSIDRLRRAMAPAFTISDSNQKLCNSDFLFNGMRAM